MPDYPTPDYPTPATPTSISLEVRRGSPYYYPRRAGVPYTCSDCAPSKWLGLRATVWRERCCSDGPPSSDVHVGRVIYLAPLTVAPGRATREVVSLTWGSDASRRT